MRAFNVILVCGLLILSGCSSPRAIESRGATDSELKVPREVAFNGDAGRGNLIIVKVRLNGGKEMPFVVDTGAGITCVDESLAAKLGRPIGTVTAHHWGEDLKRKTYAMPAIYLGGERLRGGKAVMSLDLKAISILCGEGVVGILGMDVLQNYCVQMDFASGKLVFLDGSQADKSAWGRAFPIMALSAEDPRPTVAGNLLGEESPRSLIDSGYDGAGWLMPKRYEQWTNRVTASSATAQYPDGRFFGETYPDLKLAVQDVESDGLGVEFLARHLVTLDFPEHTLYLKRTSTGPLPDGSGAVVVFLKNLKERGELPGWSKDEHGKPRSVKQSGGIDTVMVEVEKNGESFIYHYQVKRAAEGKAWKLVKAWRSDARGRVLENYRVHPQSVESPR